MRILYVALKWDYGDASRGLSFEHWNFYHSLVHMGHDIVYFDLGSLHERLGREAMNRRLVEVARRERPDLAFFVLFKDEVEPEALDRLRAVCPTVTWFCDDHWRFESFSRRFAPCFDRVVTTAASALPKYAALGFDGVIKSQWACNHFLYRPLPDAVARYDVTFVGLPHGDRVEVLGWLQRRGVSVRAWGHGWPAGRLAQEDMIRVFNESRINLNLANAFALSSPRVVARALVNRAYLTYRRWRRRPLDLPDPLAPIVAAWRMRGGPREQIKGRTFEIPGCGGFQLTTPAEDLHLCFQPGDEIAFFRGRRELLQRVLYFLEHEDERRTIAAAGYRRTLAEHTYVHRFTEIFLATGLNPPTVRDALASGRLGETFEVG